MPSSGQPPPQAPPNSQREEPPNPWLAFLKQHIYVRQKMRPKGQFPRHGFCYTVGWSRNSLYSSWKWYANTNRRVYANAVVKTGVSLFNILNFKTQNEAIPLHSVTTDLNMYVLEMSISVLEMSKSAKKENAEGKSWVFACPSLLHLTLALVLFHYTLDLEVVKSGRQVYVLWVT